MNAASPQTDKQFFNLDDANQRLPLVKSIVQDIVTLFRDVHERRDRLARIRQSQQSDQESEPDAYSEETDQFENELRTDIARLEAFVDELGALGVELKDYTTGLVDFPTIIDGREAYLCWKLGEEEVAYWHDLDSGFSGRQSLRDGSISVANSFDPNE